MVVVLVIEVGFRRELGAAEVSSLAVGVVVVLCLVVVEAGEAF